MKITKTGSYKLLHYNSVGFVLIFNEMNWFEEWLYGFACVANLIKLNKLVKMH